jgi:hypothetical protein
LAVGTVLVTREGNFEGRSATVTADGLLEMDGRTYDSPSGAGKEVLGRAVNGWSLWRLPDGARLMDVRQRYLGTYVDRKGLYDSFWREVLERIKTADPHWTQASACSSSWITLPYGASAAHYVLAFTVTGPAVDLEFASADREANLAEYQKFSARRQDLEAMFGEPLLWDSIEDRKSCRIRYSRANGGEVADADIRDELIDWFVSSALRLRTATQAIRSDVGES